jgi:predicted nucleic acid-binding protein
LKALVDTCGWIEWLTDGPLADRFAPYLRQPADLLMPTLVQYELHRWICRERDAATALEVIGFTQEGEVVPLDTPLAILASQLATAHGLAMADAVVYATARQAAVDLVTCDSHFEALPGVTYFPRT